MPKKLLIDNATPSRTGRSVLHRGHLSASSQFNITQRPGLYKRGSRVATLRYLPADIGQQRYDSICRWYKAGSDLGKLVGHMNGQGSNGPGQGIGLADIYTVALHADKQGTLVQRRIPRDRVELPLSIFRELVLLWRAGYSPTFIEADITKKNHLPKLHVVALTRLMHALKVRARETALDMAAIRESRFNLQPGEQIGDKLRAEIEASTCTSLFGESAMTKEFGGYYDGMQDDIDNDIVEQEESIVNKVVQDQADYTGKQVITHLSQLGGDTTLNLPIETISQKKHRKPVLDLPPNLQPSNKAVDTGNSAGNSPKRNIDSLADLPKVPEEAEEKPAGIPEGPGILTDAEMKKKVSSMFRKK